MMTPQEKKKSNDTFEAYLTEYANTLDSTLFNDHLHLPLSVLYNWLQKKLYSYCNPSNIEDLKQLVMIRVMNDMKYYKTGKGMTAHSFAHFIMKQEIFKNKRKWDKQEEFERVNEDTLYKNVIDEDDSEPAYNLTYNENPYNIRLGEMVEALKLFYSSNDLTKEQRRVIKNIIKTLSKPKLFTEWLSLREKYIKDNGKQYITPLQVEWLATKSKVPKVRVKETIDLIMQHQLL